MPRRSLSLAGEIPLYQGDIDADLRHVARGQLAEQITGGLVTTSKMPCPSWGISAFRCQLGNVLAEKPGTVCSDCYARKGRYRFTNVQAKMEERYHALFNPLWTPAMVMLINWYAKEYFRWFSSGDLQGENHLRNIVTIAENTPEVKHWLPTREAQVVRAIGEFPANLVVRVSGAMIDGPAPRGFQHVSRVNSDVREGDWFECPSRDQGNSCQDCRECWNPDQQDIAYRLH